MRKARPLAVIVGIAEVNALIHLAVQRYVQLLNFVPTNEAERNLWNLGRNTLAAMLRNVASLHASLNRQQVIEYNDPSINPGEAYAVLQIDDVPAAAVYPPIPMRRSSDSRARNVDPAIIDRLFREMFIASVERMQAPRNQDTLPITYSPLQNSRSLLRRNEFPFVRRLGQPAVGTFSCNTPKIYDDASLRNVLDILKYIGTSGLNLYSIAYRLQGLGYFQTFLEDFAQRRPRENGIRDEEPSLALRIAIWFTLVAIAPPSDILVSILSVVLALLFIADSVKFNQNAQPPLYTTQINEKECEITIVFNKRDNATGFTLYLGDLQRPEIERFRKLDRTVIINYHRATKSENIIAYIKQFESRLASSESEVNATRLGHSM